MNSRDIIWNNEEKTIARLAYEKAYQKEMAQLLKEFQQKTAELTAPEDIWEVYDFLSYRRKEINRKYDYRYSVLLRVFGQLLAEGLVQETDLTGLSNEKIGAILNFSSFWQDTEE